MTVQQVPSIASFPENAVLLGNRIPEITGFYNKHYNYSGFVFVGEQEGLFSGNKGRSISPRILHESVPVDHDLRPLQTKQNI